MCLKHVTFTAMHLLIKAPSSQKLLADYLLILQQLQALHHIQSLPHALKIPDQIASIQAVITFNSLSEITCDKTAY